MNRGFGVTVLTLVLMATATGCAGYHAARTDMPGELAWPIDRPQVRLVALIDLTGAQPRGGARVLNWLGGEKAPALFRRPYAVAWEGEDVLVTDPDAGRVARIGPRGRITLSPEGALEYPIGIAACSRGIVVTEATRGRVALLDTELHPVRWLAKDLSRPTGIACRGDELFFTETAGHRIHLLETDGNDRKFGRRGTAPGQFNFPASVALDGGTLLVGDTLNFRVQRLEAGSGKPLNTFGQLGDSPGETPRIKGVAVDAAGHVWVSDALLDRISLYDRDGNFLMSVGGTGAEPGQFSFPAGIATHSDGRVVVADSLNGRLQIFRVAPHPAGEGD